MHSSAVWLNPHPSLGRMRKDPEITVFGESLCASVMDVFRKMLIQCRTSEMDLLKSCTQVCEQNRVEISVALMLIYALRLQTGICNASVGCTPVDFLIFFSQETFTVRTKTCFCFSSLTSFQKSSDIGLQGK